MSIWMEMRCDANTATGCYSAKNNGPMSHAFPTTLSLVNNVRDMEREAKDMGWRRVKTPKGYRWHCPACKEKK